MKNFSRPLTTADRAAAGKVKAPDENLEAPDLGASLWSWLKRGMATLPLLVCIALFLFHFSLIRKYAVNIPNMDDWAMFSGDNHPASLDLPWLYGQHNEHRTSTTKAFVWLQFQLNGWNVRTHLLIDFIIYGLYLTLLVWLARRIAPHLSTQIVLAFMIFFLSPIIWLEHFMAYPVAVHFWLIFFVVSAYFLFSGLQKWGYLLIGSLSSILSIYSFAAGFVTSLILLIALFIFKALRIREAKEKRDRTREILQSLLVTILVGGALVVWIIGYQKPALHPSLNFPYQSEFWRFYLNLISFSFGIDQYSVLLGGGCLLIILVPIGGEIWKRRGRLTSAHWASMAIVFAILADLAAISMGRAGFGIAGSKVQEYAEHGMPLTILSVLNWSLFLKDRKLLRGATIGALWIFLFLTFQGNWTFDIYRTEAVGRLEGVRCIRVYYDHGGDVRCPTILPPTFNLARLLEQAKKLNASIYREIVAKGQQKPQIGSKAYDYLGAHDAADCHHISGWAYDKSDPDAIVVVAIYDGNSLLSTSPAINFRPDLLNAGIGTGLYSFEYLTPPALKDGRPHSIRVQFAGTRVDLPNSPKVLTCSPP